MSHNVILIGPMGAGKSTIGKQLANRLSYDFIDTDHYIEEKTGADIPWIFDIEGEQGFRDRETNALSDVVKKQDTVIATGGGIVLREENRALIKNAGLVVYLTASVDQLVERTFKDKKRPLLQVPDPKLRIIELYEQRDPLYRSLANHIVLTDKVSAKNIVSQISAFLA